MAILELHSIHKSFRRGFWGVRTPVLHGLDLAIERGEVYGFLGHNGAGKSTTMKVILGLLRPDRGTITVFGEPRANARARARIGYLSEEIGLYPQLNADEMLMLAGDLFRIPRATTRARAGELIERVGLSPKRSAKIKHYSKGMRQRLGLATALINDPELLILDEPYSGLDPIGRKELRALLVELKKQGKTILMSSHIVPDVEAVCDRVGILHAGRIARVLDLHEFNARTAGDVEVTVAGVDATRLAARDYAESMKFSFDDVAVIRCASDQRLKDLINEVYASNGKVLEVKPLRSGLEDMLVDAIATTSTSITHEPQLSRR